MEDSWPAASTSERVGRTLLSVALAVDLDFDSDFDLSFTTWRDREFAVMLSLRSILRGASMDLLNKS